jgi:hypothetical protein
VNIASSWQANLLIKDYGFAEVSERVLMRIGKNLLQMVRSLYSLCVDLYLTCFQDNLNQTLSQSQSTGQELGTMKNNAKFKEDLFVFQVLFSLQSTKHFLLEF